MALLIGSIFPTNLSSHQLPESFRRKNEVIGKGSGKDHFTVMRLSRPRTFETSAAPTVSLAESAALAENLSPQLSSLTILHPQAADASVAQGIPDSCQRSVSTNHCRRSLRQLHPPHLRHQRPTMAEAHHPLAPSLPLPRSISSSIIFGKRRSAMNDLIAFHTYPRRAPSIPL